MFDDSFKVEIDQDSLGDQLLPSFYAEDQTNAMNQERRREGESKLKVQNVTHPVVDFLRLLGINL